MARKTEPKPDPIQRYLTLMFVVESAMNGFMQWVHAGGPGFDKALFDTLDTSHKSKKKTGPFLPTLGDFLVFLRKPLAPDDGGVKRSAKQEDDAQRRRDEMQRVFEKVYLQRNRAMHGQRPDLPLGAHANEEGLVRAAAVLFHLVRAWIRQRDPDADKKDLFPGWRYFCLIEPDLLGIICDGELEQRRITIEGKPMRFFRYPLVGAYDLKQRQFKPHKAPGELWVSVDERPKQRKQSSVDPALKIRKAVRDSWTLPAEANIHIVGDGEDPHPDFRMIPVEALDASYTEGADALDMFGVPLWVRVPRNSQHLRLHIRPQATARTQKPRSADSLRARTSEETA